MYVYMTRSVKYRRKTRRKNHRTVRRRNPRTVRRKTRQKTRKFNDSKRKVPRSKKLLGGASDYVSTAPHRPKCMFELRISDGTICVLYNGIFWLDGKVFSVKRMLKPIIHPEGPDNKNKGVMVAVSTTWDEWSEKGGPEAPLRGSEDVMPITEPELEVLKSLFTTSKERVFSISRVDIIKEPEVTHTDDYLNYFKSNELIGDEFELEEFDTEKPWVLSRTDKSRDPGDDHYAFSFMESGSEKSRGLVEKTVLENLDKIFQGGDELLSTVAEMMTGKDKTKIFKEIQGESTRTLGRKDPEKQKTKCFNTQVALNVFSIDPTFRKQMYHTIVGPEKIFRITCQNTHSQDLNILYEYEIQMPVGGGEYKKINNVFDDDYLNPKATFQACNEFFRDTVGSEIMEAIECPDGRRLLPRVVEKEDPVSKKLGDMERRQKRAREMENSLNYLCEYIRMMGDGPDKVALFSNLKEFIRSIFSRKSNYHYILSQGERTRLLGEIKEYLNIPPEHPEPSAAASDVGDVSAGGGGGVNPLHKE